MLFYLPLLSVQCTACCSRSELSPDCRGTVGLTVLTLMSSVGSCCRGLSGAVGGCRGLLDSDHVCALSGCVGPVGPVGPVGVHVGVSGTVGCQAKHMSVSSTEHHSSAVSHRRCLPGPTAHSTNGHTISDMSLHCCLPEYFCIARFNLCVILDNTLSQICEKPPRRGGLGTHV